MMVTSRISGAIAVLTASARASEGTEAGEVLSLLQKQVHKHNATVVNGEPGYADVDDSPNKLFPGYDFHDFKQSLCTKFGEKFGLQEVGARQKCATKVIPSTVETFNKDLEAYGGCASGFPWTYSWASKVTTGHGNGLGRVDTFTAGDGPATEAVTEACRLAAEKDPRCAGANVYVVQQHFCNCMGGAIGVKANDIGYFRWPGYHLTCALKSLPASKNPQEKDATKDGVTGELYNIKVTNSIQGCSKGWHPLNGGGTPYDSGTVSGGGPGNGEYWRLGDYNDFLRPSDCVAKVAFLKNGGTTRHSGDSLYCKDAIGVRFHSAGREGIKGPQADCGCLKPNFKASTYRQVGPAEFGGSTASSKGSWVCLLDDGDATKGETFLPVPKKSGKYSADGPSAGKPDLSPEEKKKCKADRSRLRAARKAKKDAKVAFKAARAAFKAAKDTVKTIKGEMENC